MKTPARAGIVLFLYVWLMVGFAIGTATLLGPARWITTSLRGSAWSGIEDYVMIGLILVYVVLSFLLAAVLTALIQRAATIRVRFGVPAVATMAAALSLWGWMNPAVYATAAGSLPSRMRVGPGAEFAFGPYPDKERLQELKQEGVTAVVSLQHPAVLPFEPSGISGEQAAAREVGITFIHAPMLPWVSSNEASLEKIRALARSGYGRYYVHCGLGRDRTNIVKRMLEGMGADTGRAEQVAAPRDFRRRQAERGDRMERGNLMEIEPDVWLIPYPNRQELYGNMLAGQVRHVLVLLDEQDQTQQAWSRALQEILREHSVPATFESLGPGQRARTADLVALARQLPRPLVVIFPFTPPLAGAAVAEGFVGEWKSMAQAAR